MKKLLSIIIALALVLSVMLVSCKKETAESLVRDAIAKVDSHDAVEADMKIDIVVSMAGIEMEIPMEIKQKSTGEQSDSPTIHSISTTSMFGMEVTTEEYSEGEWTYTLVEGIGTKTKREDDSADKNDFNFDIPSEVFEGVEIVKNEDGTKTVEFILTADILRENFSELGKDFMESLGEGEISDAEISDAKVKVTVNKDEMKEFSLSLDAKMTTMGMEGTIKVNFKCDFIAFDNDVVITPPEGYLYFTEE